MESETLMSTRSHLRIFLGGCSSFVARVDRTLKHEFLHLLKQAAQTETCMFQTA